MGKSETEIGLPAFLEVKKANNKGKGLFTRKFIPAHQVIFYFSGRIGDDTNTSKNALQIGKNAFLESELGFDNFLNHSCEPNCYIDFDKLCLVSLKEIKKNDEITVNYNASEYDLVSGQSDISFDCTCESANCIKRVKGYKFLSEQEKRKLKEIAAPFIFNC